MTRTPSSRRRWQIIGGIVVAGGFGAAVVLGEIGASQAARGLGLAVFFLVWPVLFLAVAPPAKPGLDPVTAKYYNPPGAGQHGPADPGEATESER